MKFVRTEFIAAEPGWKIILPLYEERDVITGVYRMPVIAWQFTIDSSADGRQFVSVLPVTVENENFEEMTFVLEQPDGRFFAPDDRDLTDEADIIAFYREWDEQKRAAKKEKAF